MRESENEDEVALNSHFTGGMCHIHTFIHSFITFPQNSGGGGHCPRPAPTFTLPSALAPQGHHARPGLCQHSVLTPLDPARHALSCPGHYHAHGSGSRPLAPPTSPRQRHHPHLHPTHPFCLGIFFGRGKCVSRGGGGGKNLL